VCPEQVSFAHGPTSAVIGQSDAATLGWAEGGVKPVTTQLRPGRQEVTAGLVLFGTSVLSAEAFKSGELRLAFDDGRLLRVAPDPAFEAWTANGQPASRVARCPSGKAAGAATGPAEETAPARSLSSIMSRRTVSACISH
jgi:hypothetical protein